MLIEFSVTNFLSFYEKQTLSMVADNATELQDTNTFLPTSKSEKVKLPRLVSSASIYGANAAGKSNLLVAMNRMKSVVLSSTRDDNPERNLGKIHPHALHKEELTEFEIIFIAGGVRYQYGFATNRQLITEEWLFAFPSGRAQQWLSRVYVAETQEYKWYINSTFVKGDKERWKEATRKDALFVSTATLLNSQQFGDISRWFKENIHVVGQLDDIRKDLSINWCQEPEKKTRVLNFLQAADLSIDDIIKQERPLSLETLPSEIPLEVRKKLLQELADKDSQNSMISEIIFSHKTSEHSFSVPLELESQGTRYLFQSAGMWLDVLEKGRVICVDELERSLHPYISNFLVTLFNDPETNPNHAQLIFTTHDTTLLNNDLSRRDQVWFVEKDVEQVTHLYPLTDYKPRKQEALQKGYLQGRYGALPYVSISKLFE